MDALRNTTVIGIKELEVNEKEGAEGGPETVSAMADGVAQGEIFPEREYGDDGGGDSDDGGVGEEDDGDDDGNKNEGGGDAFPSHEKEGYQMRKTISGISNNQYSEIGKQEEEMEAFDRQSPPFAVGVKDGAPPSSFVAGTTGKPERSLASLGMTRFA